MQDKTNNATDISIIESRVTDYAKSVSAVDTVLASRIWINSDDASFIHPLGHEKGWKSVKENVYIKLMEGLFYERKLVVKNLTVHTRGQSAWAEFYWDFKARLRSDSTEISTQGRESQFYIMSNDEWKLVHVHYSGMPVKEVLEGL